MIKLDSKVMVSAPLWKKRTIEWPTVFLFLVCFSTFVACIYSGTLVTSAWWPVLALVNTICAYSIFTVIHEASHKNISRRFPRLEYGMGVLAGLLLHGSFEQFITLHLRHHSKVNQTNEDPDLVAQGPITLTKLLQWGAMVITYSMFYIRHDLRKRDNQFWLFAPYAFLAGVYMVSYFNGHLMLLLCLWTLPVFLGLMATIYAFDHLPHKPHTETAKYLNTRVFPHSLLDWLTFMQTYHLVHHLWPSIPWLQYRACYYQRRKELLKVGAIEIDLFTGLTTPASAADEVSLAEAA